VIQSATTRSWAGAEYFVRPSTTASTSCGSTILGQSGTSETKRLATRRTIERSETTQLPAGMVAATTEPMSATFNRAESLVMSDGATRTAPTRTSAHARAPDTTIRVPPAGQCRARASPAAPVVATFVRATASAGAMNTKAKYIWCW
jgi:hypothetical protein